MSFGGETYDEERDGRRLGDQMQDVLGVMLDGKWRTLRLLNAILGHPEASISARLRDLRKKRFGGYRVERQYLCDGIWEYRVLA